MILNLFAEIVPKPNLYFVSGYGIDILWMPTQKQTIKQILYANIMDANTEAEDQTNVIYKFIQIYKYI